MRTSEVFLHKAHRKPTACLYNTPAVKNTKACLSCDLTGSAQYVSERLDKTTAKLPTDAFTAPG